MKKAGKWLKVVGNILLWAFVVFAVLVTILVSVAQADSEGIPTIGGKGIITVQSNSMSPTFRKGDVLIVTRLTDTEKGSCKVGDVITYLVDLNGDGTAEINTHRIIEVTEKNGYVYYVTQGDNKETNAVADTAPVQYNDVLAKWNQNTKVAGLGGFLDFLRSSTGFLCVIVIPLALFFLFELYHFIITIMKIRKKDQISPEDREEIKRKAVEEYLRQQQVADGTGSSDEDKAEQTEKDRDLQKK